MHALALDHPLAVLDAIVPTGVRVLNPHWRGGFESSVTATGAGADCRTAPGGGCQKIAWPAGQAVYARPGLTGSDAAPYRKEADSRWPCILTCAQPMAARPHAARVGAGRASRA